MSQAGQSGRTIIPPGTYVETLTSNVGGAVGPNGSGNINVLGGNNITGTGNPGTNTITFNVTGTTNHAVQVGNASGSLTSLAVGATGTVLAGNTGADPSFQALSGLAVTSIAGDTGGAQTGAITLTSHPSAGGSVYFNGAAGTITLNVTDASANTFVGSSCGNATLTGLDNTALGKLAAPSLTIGSDNVSIGYEAMVNYTTGSNSTAVGAFSMFHAIAGASNNTAIGYSSLYNLAGAGTGNTCIGLNSGSAFTTTESNNIIIGNTGVIADNNRIRIGTNGTHTSCFVAGIDGVNVGSVATVVTEASDKLGTAVITAGAGISVTPGANTITIAATGSGMAWSVITANQTAVVENGYFCNKAGTLALALPAASAVGDVIEVYNMNTATGTQITQAAGQQIFIGNTSTTLGVTGTLTSSQIGDTLKLVCSAANTTWRVLYFTGNWTPA